MSHLLQRSQGKLAASSMQKLIYGFFNSLLPRAQRHFHFDHGYKYSMTEMTAFRIKTLNRLCTTALETKMGIWNSVVGFNPK